MNNSDPAPTPEEQLAAGSEPTENKHLREIKDPYSKQEPPHKETASTTIIASQLNEILKELVVNYGGRIQKLPSMTVEEALSAINSLTLKQVLTLIGENETASLVQPIHPFQTDEAQHEQFQVAMYRDALRAKLRQSAERIFNPKSKEMK